MLQNRNYKVTVPATLKVFTVTEVKTAIKAIEEITVEDDFIQGLIDAATDWAEKYTNRALLPQTVLMVANGFPIKSQSNPYASIELFRSPVRSISAIRYVKKDADTDALPELILPAEFRASIIHEPALVFPKDVWPTDADAFPGAVQVEFEAGYSNPSDIPAIIRRGMMIFISDNYEYRENDVQMKTTKAENYLRQHRVEKF